MHRNEARRGAVIEYSGDNDSCLDCVCVWASSFYPLGAALVSHVFISVWWRFISSVPPKESDALLLNRKDVECVVSDVCFGFLGIKYGFMQFAFNYVVHSTAAFLHRERNFHSEH